ncbi:FRG domain-containing protein [Rhodococcus sp. 15-649-2-2]|uniref:FRG domain-containing protein n=1 Tax=Rhodococcus sp. 15-649-2-2 TaxID=2023140 RepID=UPI00359429D2
MTGLEPLKQFWFRGQGCSTRHLMPSLWRRLTESAVDPPIMARQVLDAETRLLTRFRQRSLPYWPAGYPQSDWEHLFAMQHYGVPTRLLDWTTSLLMAVFFSLEHDPTRCECGTGSCTPNIWILDPVLLNQTNPRLDGLPVGILATSDKQSENWEPGVDETLFAPAPVAIYGTHNSERIAAQHGAFTVGGKTVKPLDEIVTDGRVLKSISLTAERKVLRSQLQLLGVSRASAYPGLTEVAYDIAEEEIG